jgi:hypothetical protein
VACGPVGRLASRRAAFTCLRLTRGFAGAASAVFSAFLMVFFSAMIVAPYFLGGPDGAAATFFSAE